MRYRVCVFSEFLKIFRTLFSLGVSVCTHTRQVEDQRCSRTGRVKKNHKILGKNTIFNEHPLYNGQRYYIKGEKILTVKFLGIRSTLSFKNNIKKVKTKVTSRKHPQGP